MKKKKLVKNSSSLFCGRQLGPDCPGPNLARTWLLANWTPASCWLELSVVNLDARMHHRCHLGFLSWDCWLFWVILFSHCFDIKAWHILKVILHWLEWFNQAYYSLELWREERKGGHGACYSKTSNCFEPWDQLGCNTGAPVDNWVSSTVRHLFGLPLSIFQDCHDGWHPCDTDTGVGGSNEARPNKILSKASEKRLADKCYWNTSLDREWQQVYWGESEKFYRTTPLAILMPEGINLDAMWRKTWRDVGLIQFVPARIDSAESCCRVQGWGGVRLLCMLERPPLGKCSKECTHGHGVPGATNTRRKKSGSHSRQKIFW